MGRFIEKLTPYRKVVAELPRESIFDYKGQRIHIRDEGEGPVYLLLHGLAASLHSFRELYDRMVPGSRLIAMDLNGFGYTERPKKPKHYQIEHQTDLIFQLIKSLGIESAVVVGHSYGAAVGTVFAKRYPRRVRGLVLISPPHFHGEAAPWYVRNWLGGRVAFWLTRLLLSRPEKWKEVWSRAIHVEAVATKELSEVYRKQLLIQGLRDAFFGLAESFVTGLPESVHYDQIQHPVMILAGREDEVIDRDRVEEVAESIGSARLEWISDCGHCAPEERPELVIELLRAFEREVEA
ncbi:MAG: alpha/beta hydrolase [Verrucomicrobiota bacterium]